MQCIAFAAPVLPGKTGADRAAMASVQGERKAAEEDLPAAFAGLGSSQDPFDAWFRDVIREVHGIELTEGFQPPELVMDYRRG